MTQTEQFRAVAQVIKRLLAERRGTPKEEGCECCGSWGTYKWRAEEGGSFVQWKDIEELLK